MSGTAQPSRGAIYYTIVGSFVGAAAGGAWLGLILMSFAGLYGDIALWKDVLAGVAAGISVAMLSILCGRAAGRLPGLRVMLVAAAAALNVVAVLYLFGDWICEVSPAGPAFTNCRIPAPLGGIHYLYAALIVSPSVLTALLGAFVTVRHLPQTRNSA